MNPRNSTKSRKFTKKKNIIEARNIPQWRVTGNT